MTMTEERPIAAPLTTSCDWYRYQARPKQIIPQDGAWHTFLIWTERAWGKNRTAAEWLVHAASAQPNTEWAFVARNASDVVNGMRNSESGLVALADSHRVSQQYDKHESILRLTNGASIVGISAAKPDRLRGYNLAGAFVDQLDDWKEQEETWHYGIMPSLRVGPNPRVVVTATFGPSSGSGLVAAPSGVVRHLVELARSDEELTPAERRYRMVTGFLWENEDNLSPVALQSMGYQVRG